MTQSDLYGLPDGDAPLFRLFWENSTLNTARGAVLRERIAVDSAQAYVPPRPLLSAGAQALPVSSSPLSSVWQARVSQREWRDDALSAQILSNLLAPFAARSADPASTRGLPSGGAKYPVLVYAALRRVVPAPELNSQLAWYDPIAHGMVPIGACPAWEELAPMLGVDWPSEPAVVFFLVARAEGMLAKYGERGGRFTLIEAGTYLGALSAECAVAGLGACAIGSFHDKAVLSLLGLDPDTHMAMLAFACGPA